MTLRSLTEEQRKNSHGAAVSTMKSGSRQSISSVFPLNTLMQLRASALGDARSQCHKATLPPPCHIKAAKGEIHFLLQTTSARKNMVTCDFALLVREVTASQPRREGLPCIQKTPVLFVAVHGTSEANKTKQKVWGKSCSSSRHSLCPCPIITSISFSHRKYSTKSGFVWILNFGTLLPPPPEGQGGGRTNLNTN